MIPIRIERHDGAEPGVPASADPWRSRPVAGVDWPRWTRRLERRRRGIAAPVDWPGWVYRDLTRNSFCLEGIEVTARDVTDSLAPRVALRPRAAGRLRAHIAIMRSLDHDRKQHRPLTPEGVTRWYTAVSRGLSTASLATADGQRLASVVRHLNSPQRRLQPAVTEAARLHLELLSDPMFPGFNGILARLLLHAHLIHCGLPPVVFDVDADRWSEPSINAVTTTLLTRIETSLDRLTGGMTISH